MVLHLGINELAVVASGAGNNAVRPFRVEVSEGRKRYRLSITAESDPRPEIFQMAKSKDWVLWELHEERPRLEDVFHELTSESIAAGEDA